MFNFTNNNEVILCSNTSFTTICVLQTHPSILVSLTLVQNKLMRAELNYERTYEKSKQHFDYSNIIYKKKQKIRIKIMKLNIMILQHTQLYTPTEYDTPDHTRKLDWPFLILLLYICRNLVCNVLYR